MFVMRAYTRVPLRPRDVLSSNKTQSLSASIKPSTFHHISLGSRHHRRVHSTTHIVYPAWILLEVTPSVPPQAERALVKLTERLEGGPPRPSAGNPFLAAPEEEDSAHPSGDGDGGGGGSLGADQSASGQLQSAAAPGDMVTAFEGAAATSGTSLGETTPPAGMLAQGVGFRMVSKAECSNGSIDADCCKACVIDVRPCTSLNQYLFKGCACVCQVAYSIPGNHAIGL